MQLKWNQNVFVRHHADESLIWHKRNTACQILKDAHVFLEALTFDFQSVDAILRRIAGAYQVDVQEFESDFYRLLTNFVRNDFVDVEDAGTAEDDLSGEANAEARDGDGASDENWTPLGSFFERHHIPSELHLDLTSACTEKCVHCYIPDNCNTFLDFALIEKALREFRALGGLSVHVSGGECMLHPDFEKVLRLARELNLNILVLSNLTLCDEAKVKLLQEIDPQFVNVSLYSMIPEHHDAITQIAGSWQKTMDAILALERSGVHVRLAAPLLKENKDDFAALEEFARAHRMHLVADCDILPQCDHDKTNLDHACSPSELEAALRANKELFNRGYESVTHPASDAKVCDIGTMHICLDSLGNYYPCDGAHGVIIGNVREETLGDVWTGEKFNRLRALVNRDFGACATCAERAYCKVCPARNFNATGDVLKHEAGLCAVAKVLHKVYGNFADSASSEAGEKTKEEKSSERSHHGL